MPPTSRSCFFHSLRVHLQMNTWKNLKTKLPIERFGYQVAQGTIKPIITDMPVATDKLLRDIRWSCQKKNWLCSTCWCTKRRLPCSIHCTWKGNCLNGRFLNVIQSSTPFIQMTLLLPLRPLIKIMGFYFVYTQVYTHICIFP